MHSARKSKKVGSWQAIGALVAHYRRQARLTQERFAEVASLHVDTVGSIEQGRLALQPDRAEQFDELLGTGGALAVLVAKLPVRERIVQFAQGLVDHEQEALSILSYQTQVVPGLLQTREYCRAVWCSAPVSSLMAPTRSATITSSMGCCGHRPSLPTRACAS